MKFILGLLFTLQAHASLVQVSSVYPDLSNTSRKLKVGGTGVIFTYNSRQFVFTASHVSQGESGLEVLLQGQPVKVIGRAMSASSDLELLEVTGAPPEKIAASYDGTWIDFPVAASQRRRWIDSHNFVPLLETVADPNLDTDNVFAKSRATALGMDYFSQLLHGDALVQPGTSGSPLVTLIPDPTAWKAATTPYDYREGLADAKVGRSVVRGLAIRRERFFSQASFVTAHEMRDLIAAYIKGSPKAPVVKWRAQGALLYRVDVDHGLRETSTFAASTAGGTIVDEGNGVSMDGGDIATLAEDSPKDFLSKVSAFPTFGDQPQMYWMMTMRHPTTSAMISFWCWFDMEFYPLLSHFMFATHQSEGPHMDLVSQLGPRFGKKGTYEVTAPQYLKVDPSGVFIRLAFPAGDKLEIQLNREGLLCEKAVCPDHFNPVIEAQAASGQTYLVDLHALFFADSSQSMMPQFRDPKLGKLSDQDYYKIVYDDLQKEYGRPRISYRKKRADISQAMRLEQGLVTTVEWDLP